MNLVLGRKSFQVSETLKNKCPGMAVNKNDEEDRDQETEMKKNTGKEMLLVAHVALVFIYACIIYHMCFISLILNSSDIYIKSVG